MFRTDPINKYGGIDLDFFSSDEYVHEQEILCEYLLTEGFDDVENNKFVIDFKGRTWEITYSK